MYVYVFVFLFLFYHTRNVLFWRVFLSFDDGDVVAEHFDAFLDGARVLGVGVVLLGFCCLAFAGDAGLSAEDACEGVFEDGPVGAFDVVFDEFAFCGEGDGGVGDGLYLGCFDAGYDGFFAFGV